MLSQARGVFGDPIFTWTRIKAIQDLQSIQLDGMEYVVFWSVRVSQYR
jgi:hypothetical protein